MTTFGNMRARCGEKSIWRQLYSFASAATWRNVAVIAECLPIYHICQEHHVRTACLAARTVWHLETQIVVLDPGDDPRVVATVDAISRELRHGPLVDRYATHLTVDGGSVDGQEAGEGSFLACSFWLVEALALSGQVEQATELFEQLLELRNDVGLLAEEYDGRLGRMTGNFPQAFSHLALVDAAITLAELDSAGGAAGTVGATA